MVKFNSFAKNRFHGAFSMVGVVYQRGLMWWTKEDGCTCESFFSLPVLCILLTHLYCSSGSLFKDTGARMIYECFVMFHASTFLFCLFYFPTLWWLRIQTFYLKFSRVRAFCGFFSTFFICTMMSVSQPFRVNSRYVVLVFFLPDY